MKILTPILMLILILPSIAEANTRLYGAVSVASLVHSDTHSTLLTLRDTGSHFGFRSDSELSPQWSGEFDLRLGLDLSGRDLLRLDQASVTAKANNIARLGLFYGTTPLGKTQSRLTSGAAGLSQLGVVSGGFLDERLVTGTGQAYQPPTGEQASLGLNLTTEPVRDQFILDIALLPAQTGAEETGASAALLWQTPVSYLALAYELNGFAASNSVWRVLAEVHPGQAVYGVFYQEAEDSLYEVSLYTVASYARWPLSLANRVGNIQLMVARGEQRDQVGLVDNVQYLTGLNSLHTINSKTDLEALLDRVWDGRSRETVWRWGLGVTMRF